MSKLIIYEFNLNIVPEMIVEFDLFAYSYQEAIESVQHFNQVFRERTLQELVNFFATFMHEPVSSRYKISTFTNAFAIYQKNVQTVPLKQLPMYFTCVQRENFDQTPFGRRYGKSDMLVSFYDNRTKELICSTDFERNEIIPENFNACYARLIKGRYGDKDLKEVIHEYSNLTQQFISENSPETDPVKVTLASDEAFKKLNRVFNGQLEFVPDLLTANRSIHHLVDTLHREMFKEAFWLRSTNKATSHGITTLMFAAIRFNDFGKHPDLAADLKYVDRLIEEGSDVNAKDVWGRTALFYVAFSKLMFGKSPMPGRALMTQKLLGYGADYTVTDYLGKTALDYYSLDGGTHHTGIDILQSKLHPIRSWFKCR